MRSSSAGHLVVARRDHGAEALGLTRHRAAADPELHAPAGEDVGEGEILGQAQRVPLRHDVEHLAEPKPRGPGGGVQDRT